MAKQVTRTINKYRHTFIKTETNNGEVTVTDQKVIDFTERLGSRKLAQFIKSREDLTGYVVGMVTEVPITYAMDLDAFIAAAQVVSDSDSKEG